MLPYEPEPMAQLQARYKQALQFQFVVADVIASMVETVENVRANVFDTEDGLRIIICIEIYPNGQWLMAVSAEPATSRYGNAHYLSPGGMDRLAEAGLAAFRQISGDGKPLEFAGFQAQEGYPIWTRHLAGPESSREERTAWMKGWTDDLIRRWEAIRQ